MVSLFLKEGHRLPMPICEETLLKNRLLLVFFSLTKPFILI